MSRVKRFAWAVVSGYAALGANVIFTLVSVRIALHYLSNETFALWALISQIVGYLVLIDGGFGVAVARFLADYKDCPKDGRYGTALISGQVIFAAQAIILLVIGLLGAPYLASWFDVQGGDRSAFIFVLRGQTVVFSLLFLAKFVTSPFWSHQRADVLNWASTASFVVNGAVMWWAFAQNWGLVSLLAGQAASIIVYIGWSAIAVVKLGLLPKKGEWGRLDFNQIREFFPFARDLFFMTLGNQLLTASQVIIVTKTLGLNAAAIWTVCSRSFSLAQQATTRIFESSGSVFAEMFVRGETDRLKQRFHDIVALSASVSVALAVLGVAGNALFVQYWTNGRVSWGIENDVLLGAYLIVFSVSRCFTSFVGVTKHVRGLRFIYFFEGLTFIGLAILAAPKLGTAGIAAAALVATLIWSGAYGLFETARYLNVQVGVFLRWFRPPLWLAIVCTPVGVAAWWAFGFWGNLAAQILIGVAALAIILLASSTIGLSPSLRTELLARLQRALGRRQTSAI